MALRFINRMRTRLPCRTTSGVVYGPDRPLIVNQLKSIETELGM